MLMNLKTMRGWGAACVAALGLAMAGCAQHQTGQAITVYDLGPGASTQTPDFTRPPLVVSAIQTTRALDSSALYYRLLYLDPLQPKPYALARWSMPPAELIDQQLRELLGAQRYVIHPQDQWQLQPGMMQLHLHLDEWSHVFETPQKSYGLLKLRATLVAPDSKGARLIAQRSFSISHPSATQDAAGGIRALGQTVEKLAQELDAWLLQQSP
jgi:cholesterol transport system auxiliary component